MASQRIGKYTFLDEILLPRTIEKGVLAFFYGCTANTFRAQLLRKGIADPLSRSKTYTKAETEQIFAEFGPVYYEDALEGWRKYQIFRQNKQRHNKKRSKKTKNTPIPRKFSI